MLFMFVEDIYLFCCCVVPFIRGNFLHGAFQLKFLVLVLFFFHLFKLFLFLPFFILGDKFLDNDYKMIVHFIYNVNIRSKLYGTLRSLIKRYPFAICAFLCKIRKSPISSLLGF